VLLGNVGNVHIGGGSAGYVLATDGTGNLSWTSSPNVTAITNGNSSVSIPTTDGNVITSVAGNTVFTVTAAGANVVGTLDVTTDLTAGNVYANAGTISANLVTANVANVASAINLGNTSTYAATVTTTSVGIQTIASVAVSGVTGVEFFVKGVDANGKYSATTVMSVTDGANVDYTIYGTTWIGGTTGSLSVNIVGSNIALQVQPSSSNSTVWTTQYKVI